MADFSVTPLAQTLKPPTRMSLGEMLNFASGVQQYKQAQELNPLAVQQQQQQLKTLQKAYEQAQQMNPELLQQARQTSRTGEIALDVEEQKNLERGNMQTFFANPNNFQTNGRIDLDKINAAVPKIAPLTGSEYITKYTTLGQSQTQAIEAKQNLTKDQRSMIAQRFAVLGRMGAKDKNQYINEMMLMKQENPDNPDLQRLLDSYIATWMSDMKSGDDLPGKAIAGAATLMSPAEQQAQFAPQVSMNEKGQVLTTTQSVTGAKPIVEVSIPAGLQPQTIQGANAPGAAATAGTEIAPGMRLPYSVRRADQPYMPEPSEPKDQLSGQTYRDRLVSAQSELPQGKRNVEEVIKQANLLNEDLYAIERGGGYAGQIGRKIRMAVNSAEYEMLAKDLAKMALANATAMGGAGNTVSGLDMAAVANGTIKMPPEKLISIARRVQADQTNLDLQAKGAQIFAGLHGDNNMKAFQQAWGANADTKIFEAMNIYKAVKDPKKRKDQIDALLGNDPKEREDFYNMYENILSLSTTGLTKVKKDK